MREDAMFDGIVLRTVRRVVSHSNLDAQTVGQVLQGFLEDVSVRGVAATTVAKQQQRGRCWVTIATLLPPPQREAFTRKLAGVVTGA